ncbi:oxidoreductase [Cytophagales bacterium WSM2-2]|nr:oxidoreductase [Cytophagales bacterium WSM2-2]
MLPRSYIVVALVLFSCTSKNQNENKNQQNMTSFKSGYAEVNGIKMYYEIHGEGEPLVLIHGGGSTIGTSFSKIIPGLSSNFKIIAVELQAHGHTSDRNSPESFEQDADDVAGLLRQLATPKASFLGFSNGGNTSMQIAIRHPEMVSKLIIASSFYKREGIIPGLFEGIKQATIKDMPQPLKDAFLEINPDNNKLLNMFNKDRERMMNFQDWKDEMLASIKAPALIINGDLDVVLNEHTVAMSRLIPNSRLMILPATHGSYLGAIESGPPDETQINLIVDVIKGFMRK